jgi:hypothetical protein
MELTPMMSCGDETRRAEIVALFGTHNTSGNENAYVVAKTAAYTLVAGDRGKAFSNLGAGGSVTLTAAPPRPGCFNLFFKLTNQTFTIAAPSGATINGGASIANSAAETTAALLLIAISKTAYIACALRGTWA